MPKTIYSNVIKFPAQALRRDDDAGFRAVRAAKRGVVVTSSPEAIAEVLARMAANQAASGFDIEAQRRADLATLIRRREAAGFKADLSDAGVIRSDADEGDGRPDYVTAEEFARARAKQSKRASAKRANGHKPDWTAHCLVNDQKKIIPNLANVLVALREAPELVDAFAFDEMAQAKLLRCRLPAAPTGKPGGDGPFPRPVRDEDLSQLQEWLQYCGLPRIGQMTVHQAVAQRARELSFHPLRQWLDGLAWDGTERLSNWLTMYLGATGEPDYLRAIGRMFLISMVARVYRPGCKVDYMLVLEGQQGILKSQACKALATEDYFTDTLPDIHTKDARQHLRGKWLVEVSELAAFTRAETETLKAFVTRTHEKYRAPYGHEEVVEPRQCVFAGTTNRDTYLKDETGARRFWPFKTGEKIDIAGLARDRGQLFAEAVERYRQGEQWWPDHAFERQHIKPEQDARYEGDPWEEAISDFVENLTRARVTVGEIAHAALHFEAIARVGTADQRRISAILAKLGWKPGRDWQGRFYARRP